jgi:hypothetical protein
MMIAAEGRELVEQVAVFGIFDMGFERQHVLALGGLENLVPKGQQFQIVVFGIFRPPKGVAEAFYCAPDHRLWVANDERPIAVPTMITASNGFQSTARWSFIAT